MNRILIIDHNRAMRYSLKERLEHEGYCVDIMESYDYSKPIVPNSIYRLILCDDETIDGAISRKSTNAKNICVIVLSDMKMQNRSSDLMDFGVYGVVARKSFNMSKLRDLISEVNLLPIKDLSIKNHTRTKDRLIIGDSAQIDKVRWIIDKVAAIGVRVLIEGDNGTGKELVAHQLHTKSLRSDKPLIEVNCAAIPSELIESELFGHEKGSFTTALKTRKGKFEQADGGTLFLDEIGDMSLSAQAKVLRVLQEGKISRVGSDKDITVDVRVVAATNKNILEEIKKGNFREDLYHRLSVVVILVPTLNERIGDIPLLANYFMTKLCSEYSIPVKVIEPCAIKALCDKVWTGNIRELRNVIERFVIFCGDSVKVEDVCQFSHKC